MMTRDELIWLLDAGANSDSELFARASALRDETVGPGIYLRGLIELSNWCSKDCYYCGIRRSNSRVPRYDLTDEQVLAAAEYAWRAGYGSVVIQAGERTDPPFVARIERLVGQIKSLSNNELGITLSLGEQTPAVYARWRNAGAERYLLRIETSSPRLYARLHPAAQGFQQRLDCLYALRDAGYQVGTGVMIGLPGQTLSDLADDLLFFRQLDIDMCGMGPYIEHPDAPLATAFSVIPSAAEGPHKAANSPEPAWGTEHSEVSALRPPWLRAERAAGPHKAENDKAEAERPRTCGPAGSGGRGPGEARPSKAENTFGPEPAWDERASLKMSSRASECAAEGPHARGGSGLSGAPAPHKAENDKAETGQGGENARPGASRALVCLGARAPFAPACALFRPLPAPPAAEPLHGEQGRPCRETLPPLALSPPYAGPRPAQPGAPAGVGLKPPAGFGPLCALLGRAAPFPREERFRLTLRMIAILRLLMPSINIAATTALHALHPAGREQGIAAGANVLMPNITPPVERGKYNLYEDKPLEDIDLTAFQEHIVRGVRGDSAHFRARRGG